MILRLVIKLIANNNVHVKSGIELNDFCGLQLKY